MKPFMDDILANPDDDGVRLIFADWLEDNGDPARGEFIKAQVAVANLDPSHLFCNCSTCSPLRRREEKLWAENWHRWVPEVARAVGIELVRSDRFPWANANFQVIHPSGQASAEHVIQYSFRRGFLHKVEMSLGTFMKKHPLIFSHQPVAEVALFDRNPEWEGEYGWYQPLEPRWTSEPDELPGVLWNNVPCGDVDGRWKHYPTKQEADHALSVGCVRLGRKGARLG